MAFQENLGQFFSTKDFAVTATLMPQAGTQKTVDGILDAEYGLASEISTRQLMFHCAEADIAEATSGDHLSIGNEIYRIASIEPDGTGVAIVRLQRY